jgi:2-amino-4-hydroxy-6-hydroxymethyldihydropteridine diphosphokinase
LSDALVAFGANLGDAARTLRDACRSLGALPGWELRGASRLWRSEPWGKTDQPDFVNAVARFRVALPPRAILDFLLEEERRHGRVRGVANGPRTLDLDLLAVGNVRVREPGLRLPHPGIARRRFVLEPLAEAWPGWEHPVDGCPVERMLAELSRTGPLPRCEPLPGPGLAVMEAACLS